jgi:hypothetical protein
MKLPSFTRIILEDLSKEARKLIGPLVGPLNNFMLTIKNGLDKGITINDNLSGALKVVDVANNKVNFTYPSSRLPKAVILGGWTNTSDTSWTPSSGVSISWYYSQQSIYVTFYGLNATDKYNVSLVIFDD